MPSEVLKFVSQSQRHPQSVGAILPSSLEIAELMTHPVDFENASTLVEIGPGTGALTVAIARKLVRPEQYLGIEINGDFYRWLKERFPDLAFYHEDAARLPQRMNELGLAPADAVFCSIPWTSMPAKRQIQMLETIKSCMRPGGLFITIAYLSGFLLPSAWMLRRRLHAQFSSVTATRVAWNNVPAGFAYICRR